MKANNKWTALDIPDLTNKIAIVTGANSGIGFETVRGLARKNASVVMACRDQEKGRVALEVVQSEFPYASLSLLLLDLSELASVQRFTAAFCARFGNLHMLINNAGIMGLPYQKTVDGFELQFATNHLGHFALTGLLLNEAILNTPGARVVTVSSDFHRRGVIHYDDLHAENSYSEWNAYGRSKLANLLFAYELNRKLQTAGADAMSVAAHPGFARTNLQSKRNSPVQKRVLIGLERVFGQSAAGGALPLLYAATSPDVVGGRYYGPGGFMGLHGSPVEVESNEASYDQKNAARLWAASVELTGIDYAGLG